MAHDTFGMDLAPGLSIKLDATFVADVVDIEGVDGDTLKVIRQEYSGMVSTHVTADIANGAVINLRPGVFAPDESKAAGGSVQIWEWYGWRHDRDQRTDGTIHAKYAVFDRRYSLVGSYNLDPRSEKLNSETAVVFENGRLSAELARLFYMHDLAYSRPVTPGGEVIGDDRPGRIRFLLQLEFL